MGRKPKPEKICVVCERPFEWRRKWADVWDEVKYCSERCRRNRNRKGTGAGPRATNGAVTGSGS